METIDPTTGQPLPPDAIQRVLYIASRVHVYQIPPMASTKGHMAATWTENDPERKRQIFTGRLRLLETAVPKASSAPSDDANAEDVKVDLLLEDSSSGELFAAAPYTKPATIEQALDSGRFFAVQVVSGAHKATLGIGFVERSEAMDFNIALQDARKVLGMETGPGGDGRNGAAAQAKAAEEKKDWSLKEGQTITVNINGRGSRRREPGGGGGGDGTGEDPKAALFSIKPPPPSGSGGGSSGPVPFLPPPPSASSVKAERRRSRPLPPQGQLPPAEKEPNPKELGFDDGEFGEFQ